MFLQWYHEYPEKKKVVMLEKCLHLSCKVVLHEIEFDNRTAAIYNVS